MARFMSRTTALAASGAWPTRASRRVAKAQKGRANSPSLLYVCALAGLFAGGRGRPWSRSRLITGRHLGESRMQIFVRIDRHVVDAYFVVQMRAGRAACLAYVSDDLAADDVLAGHYD